MQKIHVVSFYDNFGLIFKGSEDTRLIALKIGSFDHPTIDASSRDNPMSPGEHFLSLTVRKYLHSFSICDCAAEQNNSYRNSFGK